MGVPKKGAKEALAANSTLYGAADKGWKTFFSYRFWYPTPLVVKTFLFLKDILGHAYTSFNLFFYQPNKYCK